MSSLKNRDPEMQKVLEKSEEEGNDLQTNSLIDDDDDEDRDSEGKEKEDPKKSALKAIASCALYSACSVSMVLVNKSLASSYNHLIEGDLNFLLVVFQAIIAVIAVEFSKSMNWVEYPSFNLNTARKWVPVNIFFCGMLFTGMSSLQHNTVPMVTIFKNITNIIVALGDFHFFGTKPELLILSAFGIMLVGAIASAKSDVSITAQGLLWMVANCAMTAGYILYMKHATKTIKLSKFGMVFYNNLLCVALLLPVTIVNGELALFAQSNAIHTFDYALKNGFAGFVGFFLNFASLNCVHYTSPTTYAIVGSLNRIPTVSIGWLMFNAEITPQTWTFIWFSMCGGFLFSYAKMRKK